MILLFELKAIKLYMQIPDFSNLSFPTQVQYQIFYSKPLNNSKNSQYPSIKVQNTPTPYQRLKNLKHKAKNMEQQLLQQTTNNHKLLRSLDYANKQSLLKRVQFLKIYGNKKCMYQHQELLQKRKKQREQFQRKSMDIVKKRKLQNELHQILLQNQEEQYVFQLQQMNKTQHKTLKKRLQLTSQREMQSKRHEQIKKGKNEFLIRKQNIQTSISMRAKSNYYSKVNDQLAIIKHYEDLIKQIDGFSFAMEDKGDVQTMANTIQSTHRNFVTNQFAIRH